MVENNNKCYAVILLAAGTSSRLGRPKQLLMYNGQTLLQYVVGIATSCVARPVIVVLGAQADIIKKEIAHEVHIVVNNDWQEGIASSIRRGLKDLVDNFPTVDGAILMVCDQPYVTPSLLNNLIEAQQNTGKLIVTCGYANTFGPPTLFHKTLFPELMQLKGDVGARSILREHVNDTEVILFPDGSLDIDTEADYQKLSKDKAKL